jgi:hypothetical protein
MRVDQPGSSRRSSLLVRVDVELESRKGGLVVCAGCDPRAYIALPTLKGRRRCVGQCSKLLGAKKLQRMYRGGVRKYTLYNCTRRVRSGFHVQSLLTSKGIASQQRRHR